MSPLRMAFVWIFRGRRAVQRPVTEAPSFKPSPSPWRMAWLKSGRSFRDNLYLCRSAAEMQRTIDREAPERASSGTRRKWARVVEHRRGEEARAR